MDRPISRRDLGRLVGGAAALPVLGAAGVAAVAGFADVAEAADGGPKSRTPVGTVFMRQGSAGFFVAAAAGEGTLRFQGKSYDFVVGSLGAGGFGASMMTATGNVYDLTRLQDFVGPYGQLRLGAVLGAANVGSGQMWLKNPNGVYISLHARREGLMLATGADGVVISWR